MKTLEQKAKAYDEALERAKKELNTCGSQDCDAARQIFRLFPELKESEDERIRKELLEHCKNQAKPYIQTGNKYSQIQSWIDWLEKQSENNKWKPSKDEMDALYGLAYITNKMDDKKDEAITKLYQDLKREFFNGSSYENMFPNTEDGVRRSSTIQVLEYARSLDTYNQFGKADIDKNIAWLEKQGEQKPVISDSALREGITHFGITQYQIDNWLKKYVDVGKQGKQKPADKAEPKFHECEWITNGYDVLQISDVDIENRYYNCVNGYDGDIDLTDKEYHLWTIQDAKDGDVLYINNTMSESIMIYKSFNNGIINKHASYNKFGFEGENYLTLNDGYIIPATKEQRDLLFQKMHEAGYMWDSEKLELKKIIDEKQIKKNLQDNGFRRMFEQKSADSYCQENCKGFQETGKCFADGECKAKRESEQKLSDEEMKTLLRTEYEKGRADAIADIHWLKSLRPQNRWKPSDEQIKALDFAANCIVPAEFCIKRKVLKELSEQLKKLKED